MLSPEIKVRIDRVKQTIRRWFFINGITSVMVFLALFSITTFLIDWFVPDLPSGVRMAFLLIGFGILTYIIFRNLIYPLNKPISDEDIAVCVEQAYPELKERLISSVQLSRVLDGNDRFNSAELVQVLIKETNEIVQPLDFYRLINTRPVKRAMALVVSLLIVIVTYASVNPLYAGIWFNRILGGNTHWPKKTYLEVKISSDTVAKGQDVNIEVTAVKGAPDKVYVHYEFFDTGEKGFERMSHDQMNPPNKFKHKFSKVNSSFKFHASGGDDQTNDFTINVLPPPRVEQIQVWYQYPPYTKLADTEPSQPEIGGMIRAPVGTTVNLMALSNIPLISARLTLGRKNSLQEISLPVEKDILGKPQKTKGQFIITGDSEYVITLKADNGLENLEPVHYPIKAIIDTAPTIKVLEPKIDSKQITAIATVPIKLLTTDDYGINRISLFYKIPARDNAETASITFSGQHNSAPYGNSKIETVYPFEITELKVKEGEIINYFMEAEDNCAISQTNTTRTREMKFVIVSAAQLQKRIEEIESRIKEEVRQMLARQQKVKDDLEKNQALFTDKDTVTPAEQRTLQDYLVTQRRITQTLERITREFDEIISDIIINKLWDAATLNKLVAINDLLKGVMGDKSPRASESIARLINLANQEERRLSFNDAQTVQALIIQDLKNVLAQMEEWEDYQEVVRVVRELLQKQNEIIETIKK